MFKIDARHAHLTRSRLLHRHVHATQFCISRFIYVELYKQGLVLDVKQEVKLDRTMYTYIYKKKHFKMASILVTIQGCSEKVI